MNSFTLTAVGQLARNPELVAKGNTAYTRFCLVGNDYAGKDDEGSAREVVTSLWFVAFGPLGEAIARNSRKGDQLFVEARVRASNWTDKQGEKQYDHSFVVQGFRFGAPGRTKREERGSRREEGLGLQRGETRPNGHDRGANNGLGVGGSAAHGALHASGASDADAPRTTAHAASAARGPVTGANDPIDTGEATDANDAAGAHSGAQEHAGANDFTAPNDNAGTNIDPTPTVGANMDAAALGGPAGLGGEDVGVNKTDDVGSGVKPVASPATKERSRRVANASATTTRASEKSSGSRSGRRAAASA